MTTREPREPPEFGSYVYGVTRPDIAVPDVAGIRSGSGLRLVAWETLAAIVSDVQRDEAAAGARALRAHARVLDAAIESGPVVPMRYGTVVDDDQAVVDEVLRPHRERLDQLLAHLHERVELVVKASYEEEAIMRELVAADPSIAAHHQKIAGVDPDAAYYERIQFGERIAAALETRRERDAEELYEDLAQVADDVSPGEPLDPHMVINGAFLVSRPKVKAFDERIQAAAQAHPEMQVRYIGPLPPYSFSDVELVG